MSTTPTTDAILILRRIGRDISRPELAEAANAAADALATNAASEAARVEVLRANLEQAREALRAATEPTEDCDDLTRITYHSAAMQATLTIDVFDDTDEHGRYIDVRRVWLGGVNIGPTLADKVQHQIHAEAWAEVKK